MAVPDDHMLGLDPQAAHRLAHAGDPGAADRSRREVGLELGAEHPVQGPGGRGHRAAGDHDRRGAPPPRVAVLAEDATSRRAPRARQIPPRCAGRPTGPAQTPVRRSASAGARSPRAGRGRAAAGSTWRRRRCRCTRRGGASGGSPCSGRASRRRRREAMLRDRTSRARPVPSQPAMRDRPGTEAALGPRSSDPPARWSSTGSANRWSWFPASISTPRPRPHPRAPRRTASSPRARFPGAGPASRPCRRGGRRGPRRRSPPAGSPDRFVAKDVLA